MSSSRHPGRQSAPVHEDSEEERLPQVTRFPPRASGTEVVAGRDVRVRPSLELVDSNSFRTGAAATVDTSNLGSNVRFLGATEEAVPAPIKSRGRSTTTTTTTTTTTAAPEIAATDAPSTDRPHKAAYDLAAFYATLQNADDLAKYGGLIL